MNRNITKKQHDSKMCFVCGLKNVAGLKASFYETDDNALVATFTPEEVHQWQCQGAVYESAAGENSRL